MSNKRKKDRNKFARLDLPEVGNTNSPVDELNETESAFKGRLIKYLKSRWWAIGIIALLSLGALGAGLKYLEEDARRQMMSGILKTGNGQDQSFLNTINPFISAPLPNPTPQLSKEYIYAGDRLITVEDANATAVPPADLAVWRKTTGGWYVMGDSGVMRAGVGFGQNGDTPAAGDYDGDGKTDFSVVRPDQAADKAKWFILRSSDGVISEVHWGKDEDSNKPVQADYDGDGKTDVAIIDSTQNSGQHTWILSRSTNLSAVDIIPFGQATDIPAPADYDGDGKADVAVWRNSTKSFYRLKPDYTTETVTFTENSTEPVSGDYDGDGKADYAIRRQSDGDWIIRYSSTGAMQSAVHWGFTTDKPVQNDYDADGKVDIAVWRAVSSPGQNDAGDWYILKSSNGQFRGEHWGQADDYPVPVFYRR